MHRRARVRRTNPNFPAPVSPRRLFGPQPAACAAPPVVVFPPLPSALPHPVFCGRGAQWFFVACLTVALSLGTVLGLARACHAAVPPSHQTAASDGFSATAPCVVPSLSTDSVQRGLASLARAPGQHKASQWHRLGALLPRRVAWGMRDLRSDGAGWYQGVDGDISERALWGQSAGWSVKLVWDLRPLWAPSKRPADSALRDPLVRAGKLQQVAARLAVRVDKLSALRDQAAGLTAQSAGCARLRDKAEALLLVIGATLRPALAAP